MLVELRKARLKFHLSVSKHIHAIRALLCTSYSFVKILYCSFLSLSLSLSLSISLSGSNLNDFEVRSCVCFYKCSSRFAYSRSAQPFSLLPPPSSSESCHFNPLVSCLNEIFNKLVTRAPAVASSQPRQHNKSSTNVLGGWSPGFLTPALARFSYFTPSNSLGTPAKFSHVLPTTLFRHQLVES